MLWCCACFLAGQSLSARRAWIEIMDDFEPSTTRKSLSARRAWIEIYALLDSICITIMSLSARRAWIEITGCLGFFLILIVALRKESVDRNLWWGVRKAVGSLSLSARRAWIEMPDKTHRQEPFPSLSARRAWIEIQTEHQ